MIFRLAFRSLAIRPLRSAVLAVGFGLGIAVMAELLGVGDVILEQAHSPALQGGGDVVVGSALGPIESATFVLSDVLGADRFKSRVAAASPSRQATLYLITGTHAQPVVAHAGVPSLEHAVRDPQFAEQPAWVDEPADDGWTHPAHGDVLRGMDRFHRVPAGGDPSMRASWAEWLYFNGRTADGRVQFYLTFLAGAPVAAGGEEQRPVFVRLQLDRDGASTTHSAAARVDEHDLLASAPDIDVGENHVRLEGGSYRITLAFPDMHGELRLDPAPGRSIPSNAIHGARGWISGYVVPVLAGTFHGTLGDVAIDGAAGYHDHNWGFWEGVRWQWGQVSQVASRESQVASRESLVASPLSIVYGRVFPPPSVADPVRIPGFVGVLEPDGPIAFSTDVTIREREDGGTVKGITVIARGRQLDLTLEIEVREAVQTRMPLARGPSGAMTFLQLGGLYHVSGDVSGRAVDFTARGSAETFRY